MDNKKALIIGGFPLTEKERTDILAKLKRTEMFCIAVDGGLIQYLLMDCVPDIFIGDLDSVSESALFWYFEKKNTCILLNRDKDFLDIEAAVDYLSSTGIESAEVWGVTGGRMDQTFACIPLLKRARSQGIELTIIAGREKIGMIEGETDLTFNGGIGDIWSFVAIAEDVKGLCLDGFQYNLENRNLKNTETLTLSNVSVSENVNVKIDKGTIMYFNKTGRRDDVE